MTNISAQNCSRVLPKKARINLTTSLRLRYITQVSVPKTVPRRESPASTHEFHFSVKEMRHASLEIAQFLIRCKRRHSPLSLSLSPVCPPCTLSSSFPSSSSLCLSLARFPLHAGLFSVDESPGPALPRLPFARTLNTSKFHHHSLLLDELLDALLGVDEAK